MRYRWILFDADGTLFDYERAESEALFAVWTAAGFEPRPDLLATYREINGALWRRFETGEVGVDEVKLRRFADLFETLGVEADASWFSAAYVDALGTQTALLPGSEALLEGLSGRTGLALITNGIAQVQRQRLAASSIGHHFENVVISEEVGAAKPDPRIFAAAMRLLSDPGRDEVLMVGDNLVADVGGARAYGLDACWFNENGRSSADGVEPTYEIHRLEELWRVLEG